MAKILNEKIPYFVAKSGGRFYWQPSKSLAEAGWRPERLAAGLEDAMARARERNRELDAWRRGEAPGDDNGPPPKIAIKQPDSVAHAITLYKASPRFKKLAPKSQYEYGRCLAAIEAWAGDVPARAVTRKAVQKFYEGMQRATPAKANAIIRVLRVLLKFAWNQGMVTSNAAEKPGLIGTEPRLRIWTPAELEALIAAADAVPEEGVAYPSVGDAVLLAYYAGQRQGDLLALPVMQLRPAEGNKPMRVMLRQSKRRAMISVMAAPRLQERLQAALERRKEIAPACPTVLVCEDTKRPWKADHFRHRFSEIRAAAAKECSSIADAWFMDLRDTAVTNLAVAGCTLSEICSITGHGEKSALSVLRHYLALNAEMADSAIAKLIAHEEKMAAAPAGEEASSS